MKTNKIQTLSDFMKQNQSLDNPGTYEFYELESPDDITRRFIITNTFTGRAILIRNGQNRIEIDGSYKTYGNIGGKKISIMRFFERLKGLGVKYI